MRLRHLNLLISLGLLGASFFTERAGAQEMLRYSIVSNHTKAGSEVDTYGANGRVDGAYEFNDRGRGPKIEAHYVFGADGLPSRMDITGNDYLKAPVDEHFSAENGKSRWKSTSEDGSGAAGGFYLSQNGPNFELAMLAAVLIRGNGKPVKLLPAGEARIEKVTETTIEGQGKSLHLTEYAITGIAFQPLTIWLDDNLRYFGNPGTWFAMLREGWEDANEKLYELQKKGDDARFARLAQELARKPGHPVAFEHVRLFDSEQAAMREDMTIVVDGQRITQVGPWASTDIPKNAERIDSKGKTLLPGMFDVHAHAQQLDGILNIASGVTSVRDMGNDIEELTRLQGQWQDGTAIGPRVWKAGFIDGPGQFQAPTGIYVTTPEEAKAAVNKYADLGFIQIKLYSSLKPELVPGIVKQAHERGLRVSGHVPNGMIASQFVEDGADELQHINFIFLNFLAGRVKDTRTPERFTAVGTNAAKLDLESKEVQEFLELLKAHHTTVDVTLGAFEGMFTGRPGKVSPEFAAVVDRLPAQVQRGTYTGGLPVTAETDLLYKDSYSAMLKMTKKMYDGGIPVLAGTDGLAGIMMHRELELEVKAGIPPVKALQIATWNAAKLLKQEKELGSIAPGKMADLVLVEGNPAADISNIRRCRIVMKGGTLYKSDAAYAAVGIKAAN
jgi:imidazolonepropionase-like amidohydrolase